MGQLQGYNGYYSRIADYKPFITKTISHLRVQWGKKSYMSNVQNRKNSSYTTLSLLSKQGGECICVVQ